MAKVERTGGNASSAPAKPIVSNIMATPAGASIPEPHPGEYLLERLDKKGNGTGEYFSVTEKMYLRTYQHLPDYAVKKNPND